jgi:hypothetical protein
MVASNLLQLTGVTYIVPTPKPNAHTIKVTNQRFHLGYWSQTMVMTPPVSEVTLPIPRANNIRKKSTAKSYDERYNIS